MKTVDFLEDLSNTPGISGHEYLKEKVVKNAFKDYVDEIKVDNLGNVICIKKGASTTNNNPRIMLAGHMDEIGLMVNKIEDNGFLRFTSVGGIDPRTILSQEVIVHGKKDLFGVIGAKPPHLQGADEQNKAVAMKDMAIDIGYSKEEVENLVSIGDPITINRKFTPLLNDRVSGKALDNKAGVASLLECAKELSKIKHSSDVYFVMTTQEEVGLRGAEVSTYSIDPDIGIAVDVGFGSTPELPVYETNNLGEGPGITIGPNVHEGLRKHLIEVAKNYNIKFQEEIATGGTGTDGNIMQMTRGGVPVIILSIPLRYMHTSVEVISTKDMENTGKLLAFFISSISTDNLEGLLCY